MLVYWRVIQLLICCCAVAPFFFEHVDQCQRCIQRLVHELRNSSLSPQVGPCQPSPKIAPPEGPKSEESHMQKIRIRKRVATGNLIALQTSLVSLGVSIFPLKVPIFLEWLLAHDCLTDPLAISAGQQPQWKGTTDIPRNKQGNCNCCLKVFWKGTSSFPTRHLSESVLTVVNKMEIVSLRGQAITSFNRTNGTPNVKYHLKRGWTFHDCWFKIKAVAEISPCFRVKSLTCQA